MTEVRSPESALTQGAPRALAVAPNEVESDALKDGPPAPVGFPAERSEGKRSPEGAVTVVRSPEGAVTVVRSPEGAVTVVRSPEGAVTEVRSPEGAVTVVRSPEGAVT
ncbi:MAG: hypothetical protein EX268_13220, partial [Deltaproteobacteria bacterium]